MRATAPPPTVGQAKEHNNNEMLGTHLERQARYIVQYVFKKGKVNIR